MSEEKLYVISEERLKRFENGGYFDVVLTEIRSRPLSTEMLKKENLNVAMVAAYESGLKEGARKARKKPRPPCEECRINSIIEQKRGCLTCRDPECPVWQAADQNCWKSQGEHDALIAAQATAAENKRVLGVIEKEGVDWLNRIERWGSPTGERCIVVSLLATTRSLRLAQPEPKERGPE